MTLFGTKKKRSLFALTLAAIATPMLFAQTTPMPTKSPAFEVASIRQNLATQIRWRMNFTPDGVSAKDVTLLYAIQEAYGVYSKQLWSGGPPWLDQRRFDIEAKFDVNAFPKPAIEQRRAMLQQLLADRFKLVVHHEPQEFPLYALTVAKNGPKLQESKPEDIIQSEIHGPMCLHARGSTGYLELKGCSMQDLAAALTSAASADLGRTIVDQTGLTARYNYKLNWTPDKAAASTALDASGPSIFTALEEQLGLKLNAFKGPLETIVIDHVEMPTEN
jgi:uncharacterized protein (TIGR03435 family)